jgi:hypothetical protein
LTLIDGTKLLESLTAEHGEAVQELEKYIEDPAAPPINEQWWQGFTEGLWSSIISVRAMISEAEYDKENP